jgi:hypothetical protein
MGTLMSDTVQNFDADRPIYLRIGDWHSAETSRNYSTGDTEAGISVYDIAPSGGIILPPENEWSRKDLLTRLRSGAPRHLVQGAWVGSGGDGEPLLRGIVRIGSWPLDLPAEFRSSVLDLEDEGVIAIEEVKTFLGEIDDAPAGPVR